MSESKRFEDWTKVDCNNCQHYWTDTCDGVPVGSEKPCTSFLATRNTDIPRQIEWLRKRLNRLNLAVMCVALSILIHYLVDMFGG